MDRIHVPMAPLLPRPLSIALRLIALVIALGLVAITLRRLGSDVAYGKVYRTEDPEQQRRLVAEAVEIDPANGDAWFDLARYRLSDGSIASAQAALDHALTTLPNYRPFELRAETLYAQAYQDVTTRYDAMEALDHALSIYPHDNVMLNRAGRVALWLGDADRAEEYMRRSDVEQIIAHDFTMQSPDMITLQADVALAQGERDQAIQLYRRLVFLQPNSSSALYALAQLVADEDPDEAYSFIRRGWNPGLSADHLQLAAQQAMGQFDWEFLRTIVPVLLLRHGTLRPEVRGSMEPTLTGATQRLMLQTLWQSLPSVAEELLFETAGPILRQQGAGETLELLQRLVGDELLVYLLATGDERRLQEDLIPLWAMMEGSAAEGEVLPVLQEFDRDLIEIERSHRTSDAYQPLAAHFVQRWRDIPRSREWSQEMLTEIALQLVERSGEISNPLRGLRPVTQHFASGESPEGLLAEEVLSDLCVGIQGMVRERDDDLGALRTLREVALILTNSGRSIPAFDETVLTIADEIDVPRELTHERMAEITALADILASRAQLDDGFPGGADAFSQLLRKVQGTTPDERALAMIATMMTNLGRVIGSFGEERRAYVEAWDDLFAWLTEDERLAAGEWRGQMVFYAVQAGVLRSEFRIAPPDNHAGTLQRLRGMQ